MYAYCVYTIGMLYGWIIILRRRRSFAREGIAMQENGDIVI